MTEPILINKRILVVEDNTVSQMLVKFTLKQAGAILDFAQDGKEALRKLREHIYDFVLMDIQLPEMDGFETTYLIRNEMQSSIPIIAMTAMALPGEEEKCLGSGMNGYIAKPFSLESFLDGIQKTYTSINVQTEQEPNLLGDAELSIDLGVLQSLAGTDDGYLQAVVSTFLANMPSTIAELEKHCANQDYGSLLKTAHFAKSSLSIIKIRQLLETVQTIEWQCRMGVALETIPCKVKYIVDKYPKAESLLQKRYFVEKTEAVQETLKN